MIETLSTVDIKEYLRVLSELSDAPYHNNLRGYLIGILTSEYKYIYVYKYDGKIVGTASLLIERKLSHNGSCVGHIEDVVVLPDYRNQGIARELIRYIRDVAESRNCYKLILNCSIDKIEFYRKLGFHQHEVCMRMDLL